MIELLLPSVAIAGLPCRDFPISSLALAYSSGTDIIDSVFFANTTAAIVVGKVGTSVAKHDEVISFLKEHNIK